MGILDWFKRDTELQDNSITGQRPNVNASFSSYSPYGADIFDGEKNVGMVGPIRNIKVNNERMSVRAENLYLKNDIVKTIINRYTKWIISTGLDLEINPSPDVLKIFGINWSREQIENSNQNIEMLFRTWSSSTMSDYRGRRCFYDLQKIAFKTTILTGDILVILRIDSKTKSLKVELVKSDRLVNPLGANTNDLDNWTGGIKLNEKGEVTDFCIKAKNKDGYLIIPAKNKLGLTQAYLFSMDNFRGEDIRGLSVLSASMDSVASADRYKDATVTGAEERAKIAFSIEHDVESNGVNPLERLGKMKGSSPEKPMAEDINGAKLTGTVAATLQKSVVNLHPGSKLVMHEGKTDKDFPEFIDKIFEITAAVIGIPVNVAMMIYNDSFSASRAAINDWMHSMKVDRMCATRLFFKPIVEYWLYAECANGNIVMPQYLKAVVDGNEYVKSAIVKCEFVGEMFPHIDPDKEAKALRRMLGPKFDNVPLTTIERAIRQLGNSDSDSVINQAKSEHDEYLEYFPDVKENN